jgi:hypothetical protein
VHLSLPSGSRAPLTPLPLPLPLPLGRRAAPPSRAPAQVWLLTFPYPVHTVSMVAVVEHFLKFAPEKFAASA